MGLDKWLKPEETEKKPKKKSSTKPIEKQKDVKESKDVKSEKPISKLTKFTLICPNAKCKYQKTIMKKNLTETDKLCPRCKNVMKIK